MKPMQEVRAKALKDIQEFFNEQRDEPIGVVAASEIFDFFIENLGRSIYNQALDDAKRWFSARLEDIDIDYTLLYDRELKNRRMD